GRVRASRRTSRRWARIEWPVLKRRRGTMYSKTWLRNPCGLFAFAAALICVSCTWITEGRIEDVISCEGEPDGTPCGNQYSDGIDRVCKAGACVPASCADGGVCSGVIETFITETPSEPAPPDVT